MKTWHESHDETRKDGRWKEKTKEKEKQRRKQEEEKARVVFALSTKVPSIPSSRRRKVRTFGSTEGECRPWYCTIQQRSIQRKLRRRKTGLQRIHKGYGDEGVNGLKLSMSVEK